MKKGEGALVEYFTLKCNRQLAEKLDKEFGNGAEGVHSEEQGSKMSLDEKLTYSIHERLKMNLPYITTWPQAMKIQALPANALESLKNTAELIDEICYACGDNTTDTKW